MAQITITKMKTEPELPENEVIYEDGTIKTVRCVGSGG